MLCKFIFFFFNFEFVSLSHSILNLSDFSKLLFTEKRKIYLTKYNQYNQCIISYYYFMTKLIDSNA